MAIFKCKMCGGSLEIVSGTTVVECQYCGTKQTLPRLADEKISNLYDRANHFRRNNDYDKALSIYEQILSEDRSDSEAYWSIVLCRYGIEYVEDPATGHRIPTINRAQYTSIFSDEDYKSAILYADDTQKAIYEQEAEQIDSIQKGILEVSQLEDPFDVFICYKETDANGRRTQDSVIAAELYNELSREGYKIFFSRITLEDKLGQEYEPIIFAALNSAKVMIVLGTKAEHFNAVWVKNEWSRYLSLIKNGARKMLIPAYKGMDPYDLPEEFSHLQAQDMSRLGFMQDLTHVIKKKLSIEQEDNEKEPANDEGVSIESTLDYIFLLIEDGNLQKAQQLLEQIVISAPKHPMIYVAKLLIEYRINKIENLEKLNRRFDNSPNFEKAVRFANPILRVTLENYAETVKNNIVSTQYNSAVSKMNNSTSVNDLAAAQKMFESIAGYEDADQLSKVCSQKIEQAKTEAVYQRAVRIMNATSDNRIKNLENAIVIFKNIRDFKDSEDKIDKCRRLISEEQHALTQRKKKKKLVWLTIISVIIIVSSFLGVYFGIIAPMNSYSKAEDLFNNAQYSEAHEIYSTLGSYKDSEEKANECLYIQATALRNERKWDEANALFEQISFYKDNASLIHNHTFSIIENVEPTCSKSGYTDFCCRDCNETYRDPTAPTEDHNYVVTSSKAATCNVAGYKDYKCSGCNKSYHEDVKATGHDYSDATCTSPKKCKACGVTSGSALGHTNNAKCTKCGTVLFKTLTYSGTGSKVISYSIPRGKFKVTATKTSGSGNISIKVHYTEVYLSTELDTYEYLSIYDTGDSEVGNMDGYAKSGSIVIDASSSYYGDSSWKITIEAVD